MIAKKKAEKDRNDVVINPDEDIFKQRLTAPVQLYTLLDYIEHSKIQSEAGLNYYESFFPIGC